MTSRNNKPGRIIKGTAKRPTLKEASGVWTLDEALQAHRANNWPQPNLLQPIPKSLRINYTQRGTTLGSGLNNNAYLNRRPARTGNRFTWTVSVWIKPSLTGNLPVILGSPAGTNSADTNTYIAFGLGQLLIQHYRIQIAVDARARSTAFFRDSNSWYHCVFVFDSNNTTETERIRGYVNGVRVTSFDLYSVPLGTASNFGSTNPLQIGRTNDATFNEAYWYDGLLSEYHYIDGYALDPSLFGTRGTDGIWISKPYTGDYGTNGFYLPFTNNRSSQALGYDYSNFTDYDVDKDPYRGNVALHLTGNGPAGSQNNTFTDSSPNNYVVSRNGVVTQGAFSPFSLDTKIPYNPATHGASMWQNEVTNDFPSFPTGSQGSNFTFSGDFTIEAWVFYTSSSSGDTSLYVQSGDGSTYLAFNISMSAGVYNIYLNSGGVTSAITHGLTANSWNHVAMVRSGSTITLYTNGVAKGTISNSSTLGYSSLTIHRCGGGVGGVSRYVSGFRIIKAAVYTSTFRPPRRPLGVNTNNLIRYNTEDFARWAGGDGLTITANAAVAPDGSSTASLCVPSTTSTSQNVAGIMNSPIGTNTFSVYAKSAGYRYVQAILSRTADNDQGYVTYDLQTGTIHNSSVWTGSIESVGNGWYRLIAVTSSFPSVANNSNVRWFVTSGTNSRGPALAGDGVSGVYLWGAQAEAGVTATTYTPNLENFPTAPTLLLKFDSAAVVDTAGAQNMTTFSTASITSASKYGSGALSFNGSSEYLTGQNIPVIGTGDFTMECWVNMPGVVPTGCWRAAIAVGRWDQTGGLTLFAPRSSSPVNTAVAILNGVNPTIGSTTDLTDGQWHHLALVRSNTRLMMFVDGKLEGTVSNNANITSTRLWVGADEGCAISGGGQTYFQGSIDDARITVGVARYTSEFVPPDRALPEVGGKSFSAVNVNAGTVRSFTTVGTTSWTAPSDVKEVEVLVVAGGGSGDGGAGGGAGGVLYNSAYSVTPGQTYTVTVGAGGSSSRGGNSVFGNLTAIGGGQGNNPASGGSGGGGQRSTSSEARSGKPGTPGQGFTGGEGAENDSNGGGGGGGGGASAVGGTASSFTGGNGAAGLQFGIIGTPTYYAGGGGGAGSSGNGTGGLGGGGAGGGGTSNNATAGTANTGGGGGGWRHPTVNSSGGASGGSGIVVVRYTTASEIGSFTDDSLVDSPTSYGHDYQLGGEVVGNYATLNTLDQQTFGTLSSGGLRALSTNTVRSTISVTRGKWYAEFQKLNTTQSDHFGVGRQDVRTSTSGWSTGDYILYRDDGIRQYNTIATDIGAPYTANDVISILLDCDNQRVTFWKNGSPVSQLIDLAFPSYFYYSDGSLRPISFIVRPNSGCEAYANFGQRTWRYLPPSGYNALNTKNLPVPAITQPNQFFDVVTYTGTGAPRSISSLNFQPDFVWLKLRSGADSHGLFDSVRGAGARLQSNDAGVESSRSDVLTAFTSNGFDISGNDTQSNANGSTYVAWCWRAGSSTVTNTSGTITSQVRANPTSGFSIVTYTGTGTSGQTVGHGLGTAPGLIIVKRRNNTGSWIVWHKSLPGIGWNVYLNATDSQQNDNQFTGSINSSTFGVHASGGSTNISGGTYVAYCWSEVPEFSKFGSYVGNGSSDGTFVYTGFRPKYVLIKRVSQPEAWVVADTARSPDNPATRYLLANGNDAETNANISYDFLSNGIKFRNNSQNESDATYIYIAFAETPFKTGRAR